MRYAPTLIALASIVFLLGFGSFAMATMTDHAGDCPVAIANGLTCLNAVSISDHLTAIQQLLQAIVQNAGVLTLTAMSLLLLSAVLLPPTSTSLIHSSVHRARTLAVAHARRPLIAWQSRCSHSPTFS